MKSHPLTYPLLLCIICFTFASCSKSDSTPDPDPVIDNCSGQPGPLFTAVKSLIQEKCVSCHKATNMSGGMNWEVDCNIVSRKDRIKVRAVDQGTMPPNGPLAQADKDKITNWINAGGKISN